MDVKQSIDFRYAKIQEYNETGIKLYNYAKEGILNKCLPKILFKSNGILVTFLQIIDLRIIMLLKTIDKLKKFKWISEY